MIYGQSPFGLAKQLGIDQDEAAAFHRRLFRALSGRRGIPRRNTGRNVAQTDMLEPSWAPTRNSRRASASAGRQRNLPERTAINTVIQGSAADLIKLAMIAIHRRLARGRRRRAMLLQIHDELIFEVPRHELRPLAELVSRGDDAAWLPLQVPLKVDVKSAATGRKSNRGARRLRTAA